MFEQAAHGLNEGRRVHPVDHPVVEGGGEVHHLAHDDVAADHHRSLDDAVDADDGHLRMVDHRCADDPAERAEAAQGDGRAGQLLALRLAAARGFGQARHFAGVAPEVARFGVAQHRHHQAVVALGGDADVHRAVAGDHLGLVVVARVQLREVAQRHDHGADQNGSRVSLPRWPPHFWLRWARRASRSVTSTSST